MVTLDFRVLFETQKKLDDRLSDVDGRSKIKKKFLSTVIELCESANENPKIFKYWSSNPKGNSIKTAEYYAYKYNREVIPIEGDPLLEELIDTFHFLLSLGIELGVDSESLVILYPTAVDPLDLYIEFIVKTSRLYVLWDLDNKDSFREMVPASVIHTYQEILGIYITLTYSLGYTENDIESAYYEKNKVNHERQENGY